ncbi:excisionase family DNA-binding protein [Mycolicibacterium aichiense]|uniref:excisionase family DNA-binding protein n=1 Tax=Mycolicibacterium aichiense TaxID=1799 RepID=UPI003D66D7C4
MPEISAAARYVKVAQAADRIQVSTWTVRDWIKNGRLTAHRFGPHCLRVDLHELDALGGVG